jgi:hypothetical protein
MPRLTFPIAPDGLRVPAILSPDAAELHRLMAAGQPPPTRHVRGMLDSGTTVTAVIPSLLKALGATPGKPASTQTAGGKANVTLYSVSFTIYEPTTGGPKLSRDTWTVSDLPQDLPDVDVLFGLDLIRELTMTIHGPAQYFTLDF